MSDTPETDAEELVQIGNDWRFVNVDFARKLERERDQWRKCAQETLLPLAAIKISNQHKPFSEIAPELMDVIIAAHDLIFNRLKETNE
jgi:hypothetical protein